MNLAEIKSKLDQFKGRKEDLDARIAENNVEVRLLDQRSDLLMKCNKLMSFLSQNNQDKIVKLFEHTISSGLKDLFNYSYGFRFDLKTRGDSSSTDFEIESDAFPGWSNIIMCRGRSIQEIVAMIFRLVLVKLDKRSRKILILDEPTGGVEAERQRLVSKFLLDICERFNIQLIVVTHSDELTEFADFKLDLDQHGFK